MADYIVKIRGSEDVRVEVRDNPTALNTARSIAIAIATELAMVPDGAAQDIQGATAKLAWRQGSPRRRRRVAPYTANNDSRCS